MSTRKVPKVLFGVVDLCRITGGITMLARSAFRVLNEMARKGEISLQVLVLNEAGPDSGDSLMKDIRTADIMWCNGSKTRFAAAIALTMPDLAVFDHAGPARAAKVLPGIIRPPYCVFVHGVEIGEQVRQDYIDTLKGAVLLIANSHYTRKKAESLGTDLPPVTVCWPGIEKSSDIRSETEDPIVSEIGEHALLIVGRLAGCQQHKGHDHILECIPLILRRVPDAQLVIAGDGDDMERLRQKVTALGVEKQVLFTGWVANEVLDGLYEKCAVFVMPSKGDGFGFVYLEAMSHRKPCVGLSNGSATEIIEHGVTGILVDREREEEMAAAISGLLEDTGACHEMGNAGFLRLNRMFLHKHYAARFHDVLDKALSKWKA